MPWYRFHAMHGPGHQSSSEHYYWSDQPLTAADKRDQWEDLFDDREWPIGGVEVVNSLPAYIHRSKVENCQNAIEQSGRLLAILKRTKAETKYRGYSIVWTEGRGPHNDSFETAIRTRGYAINKGGPERHRRVPKLVGYWFATEHGARDAIDLWIKVRRNINRFDSEYKRIHEQRKQSLEQARRECQTSKK